MPTRTVKRSAGLAAVLTLLTSAIASADTVGADGDVVTPGNQTFVDLGEVGPGGTVTFDVDFTLVCRNGAHPDHGTSISMELGSSVVPDGGAVTVEPGTIGPIPSTWPVDGVSCFDQPTLRSSTPARVTIHAPTTIGEDYLFIALFRRNPVDGLSGSTAVTAQLDVVGNTPPVLDLAGSFVVEGDTTGGWTADFEATADDAEDDPDPAVVCSPAVGDVVRLGTTTVSCSTTDAGGMSDTDTFDVTVVDTTAPVLSGVPADRTAFTSNGGAAVTFATPSATDVVDASPTVACAPASGTAFPVGTTTVTCTATDASDNTASASFRVTVIHANATFEQPVGNGTFTVTSSRTIPIKVQLVLGGEDVASGAVWVWLGRCGETASRVAELERKSDRWMGHVDTSGLSAGCTQVTIRSAGVIFGGFELRIDDGATATSSKPKTKG